MTSDPYNFQFIAGHLALDFVNTVAYRADPARREDRLRGEPWMPSYFVTRSAFEAQLQYLAQNATVLPLSQAVQRLAEGALPPGTVSLTFDDGYGNNLQLAQPLLKRYGMTATVFLAARRWPRWLCRAALPRSSACVRAAPGRRSPASPRLRLVQETRVHGRGDIRRLLLHWRASKYGRITRSTRQRRA